MSLHCPIPASSRNLNIPRGHIAQDREKSPRPREGFFFFFFILWVLLCEKFNKDIETKSHLVKYFIKHLIEKEYNYIKLGLYWKLLDTEHHECSRFSINVKLKKKKRRVGGNRWGGKERDKGRREGRKNRSKRQNIGYFLLGSSLMGLIIYLIGNNYLIKSMIHSSSFLKNVLFSRNTILTSCSTTFYNNKGNYLHLCVHPKPQLLKF